MLVLVLELITTKPLLVTELVTIDVDDDKTGGEDIKIDDVIWLGVVDEDSGSSTLSEMPGRSARFLIIRRANR